MKRLDIGNPDCKKVLALLDFYLSSELTIETTAEVVRHLERCPQCLAVFRIRELVKKRLQAAVSRDEIPLELKNRISRAIRKSSRSWLRRALRRSSNG
jgi:anti-sigma factor (TIGR02949 family)